MLQNYEMDEFGVIHQVEFTPIKYDKEYLSYYENLNDRTIKLGYQRLGWILGKLDRIPDSVLEIGYGTGTFIEAAQITGVPTCVGCRPTTATSKPPCSTTQTSAARRSCKAICEWPP